MRIPTTDEMDGIITPEDIALKDKVMIECAKCGVYNKQHHVPGAGSSQYKPCISCGKPFYNQSTIISLRTYDAKRVTRKSKNNKK